METTVFVEVFYDSFSDYSTKNLKKTSVAEAFFLLKVRPHLIYENVPFFLLGLEKYTFFYMQLHFWVEPRVA